MQVILISPLFGTKRTGALLKSISNIKESLSKIDESEPIYQTMFLRADGDGIGSKVGNAFMVDDVKTVTELSDKIEAGQKAIEQWALAKFGQVIMEGGDDMAVIIPASTSIEDIENLRKEYFKTVGATLSVGTGDTPSQAAQALLLAKLTGKDKTVAYVESIPDELGKLTMTSNNPEATKLKQEGYFKNEDDLNKALKDKIKHAAIAVGAMMAPALVNAPHHPNFEHQRVAALHSQLHEHTSTKKSDLHPELNYISAIESSSGKNIKHKMTTAGLNKGDTAIGRTGLMPLTVMDVVKNNPALAEKYNFLGKMTKNQITEHFNTHPDQEAEIANHHWQHLSKVFNHDDARKAYAWRHGITAAQKAKDKDVMALPYVQKFLHLKAEHSHSPALGKSQ